MLTRSRLSAASAALCAALAASLPAHATPAENDEAMQKLATDRGCMECHSIDPRPRRVDGLPPIAPSWRDVAIKYRDDPGAHKRLMKTVLSGSNPGTRHWAGKVGPGQMPPNRGDITQEEAQMLVNWMLVLVP